MASRPRNASAQKRQTIQKAATPQTTEVQETPMTTAVNEEVGSETLEPQETNTTAENVEQTPPTGAVERLHNPVKEVAEFDLTVKKVEEVKLAHNLTIQTTSAELATKVDKNPTVEGFLQRKYGLVEEDYSKRLKQVIAGIKAYVESMNMAVPVDKETGKKNQFRLLQTIRASLDTDDHGEAVICYDALLFVVSRNLDTTFNERLICRFIYQLSERDQIIFGNLVNIIINTANPRTRIEGLKNINLKMAIARVGGGYIATNMLNFYNENMK